MRSNRLFVFTTAVLLSGIAIAERPPLPTAKPESMGFSTQRLQRLEQGLDALVDTKQVAGMVTVIARHGKIVHRKAHGQQDMASGAPMQTDTIVRLYSMTKPITGVAMMMLYEEGKWRPSDPLSKFIPEFKDLKVFAGLDAQGKPVLEAPAHAPTVGELMTHTAGFTYGLQTTTPVDKMYVEANVFGSASLQEFVEKLAKIPLAYQPGESWLYSASVDIQGHLVEKLSGKSLPEFFRSRIFEPLAMVDTDFSVPAGKLSRVATIYSFSAQTQALAPTPRAPDIGTQPKMPQGGAGLYSTANDYLRFAQMLVNGGELNGVRLLAPSTIDLMRTNHAPEKLKINKYGLGQHRLRPGFGFGYDVGVFEEPLVADSTAGKGTYLWNGAAGTWFWVDPTNDLIFVGIIQRRGGAPGSPSIEELARTLTYQALVDPKK